MKLSEYFEKWPDGIKLPFLNVEVINKLKKLKINLNEEHISDEAFIVINKYKRPYYFSVPGIFNFIKDPAHELTLTEFMAIEEVEELLKMEAKELIECNNGHKQIFFYEGGNCPICEMRKPPEQTAENDYEQDDVIKFMRSNGRTWLPDSKELITLLLKRIDDSEKRCREYTDQLRNELIPEVK